MNALTLSRWQFGITTVYHFLFVPLTIGLSLIVAGMQTVWYRTGDEAWRRMTRFFGAIFLINFAMGVVTGIVQEFQFGMNWSAYSRFVGDIFGAPLAMEGLIAFFLESTFLGLWIFGWDRLSPRLHLATIWLASLGTVISMYFILAANSWMQHPVGYRINPETNRAELTSIWKVLSNSTAIVTFLHTFAASMLTAGMFVLGISAWKLLREQDRDVFRPAAHVALVLAFVASVAVAFSGHAQAQVMTRQQPMKMAAAEALWGTESHAGFSLFAVGDVSNGRNKVDISIPDGLSLLATNSTSGTVKGINDVQAASEAKFGPGDYKPIIALAYWSFRFMVGIGFLLAALCLIGLVQLRRGRLEQSRRLLQVFVWAIALPLLGNSIGWLFTEMGRQPWVVYGVLKTGAAVSPRLTVGDVGASLLIFTLLYGFLAVIEVGLVRRTVVEGPLGDHGDDADHGGPTADDGADGADDRRPSLVY